MSESTKGKLKNLVSNKELPFSLNPVDYKLNKSYDFQMDAWVGRSHPALSFRSGHVAQLSFELIFDKDVDEKCQPKQVEAFLKDLNQIKDSTKSVPLVEFAMGSFAFRGYVSQYSIHAFAFDAEAEVRALRTAITLISTGEYEHGQS